MPKQVRPTTLTDLEKGVVKALLNKGERNQDVHALINSGRAATINSGRITGIKKDKSILPATDSQVSLFKAKKAAYDQITGLCAFDNERLVRAREAMILAVELFNTPRIRFKAGVFSMLSNVAWTYLLHEFYERKGISIVGKEGMTLLISQMIKRSDCPLSSAAKKNLLAMKDIRDTVEHLTIGPFDHKWTTIFQANCLNFEKYLVELFGPQLSLTNDLGLAIQFSKLSLNQLADLQAFDLPPHIAALDAGLAANVTAEEADNLEYQFRVIYSLQSATKGTAHFHFIQPGSEEAAEIQNVLLKYKVSDELYPHKPQAVVDAVKRQSGRAFSSDRHVRAWKKYKVRPRTSDPKPENTNRD